MKLISLLQCNLFEIRSNSHGGRSWGCVALLIPAFNPLKSLISTWLGEVNSLIPVSLRRWVLVYFSSEVMQADGVWVQQWVAVPEDCADAEAVFALSAACGIGVGGIYSLLLSLQRVPSRWLHSNADAIDTTSANTFCAASSLNSVTLRWHCWHCR